MELTEEEILNIEINKDKEKNILKHKLWKLQKSNNNIWKRYKILDKKYKNNLINLKYYKNTLLLLFGLNLLYFYSNKILNDNLI